MAIRTFCDHCGNTCRSPNKFQFGPYAAQSVRDEISQAVAAYPGAIQAVLKQAQAQSNIMGSQPPKHPIKILDLCDICAPIWYERVDKLCRASDPE